MAWWIRALALEASLTMQGNNPYVGETIILRLKVRHSNLGSITTIDADAGDSIAYTVTNADTGETVASASLSEDNLDGDTFEAPYTTPEVPGVYSVIWTVSIGGSIGKAKVSFRTQDL